MTIKIGNNIILYCYFINLQRINIGERCVNSINHFLELIAKEVKNRLGILCSDRMTLDDQLASARGSTYYMLVRIAAVCIKYFVVNALNDVCLISVS